MRFEKTDYFYQIPKNNVIPELISDTDYKKLTDLGMINNVPLRNYQIQRDYKDLIGKHKKQIAFNILLGMYDIKRKRLYKIYKSKKY